MFGPCSHVLSACQPASPHAPPARSQLFLAFNATAHSLIATNLSRKRESRAADTLVRIAQLAVALSIPVALALFAGRGLLPDLFTEDVLVQREVAEVLPLLLLIMVRHSHARGAAWVGWAWETTWEGLVSVCVLAQQEVSLRCLYYVRRRM